MSCDVVAFYKNSAKIDHLLFDIRHRCHQLPHKILIHNRLLHNIEHSEWSGGVHKYDMAFANTISVATSAEGWLWHAATISANMRQIYCHSDQTH